MIVSHHDEAAGIDHGRQDGVQVTMRLAAKESRSRQTQAATDDRSESIDAVRGLGSQ